MNMMNRFNKHMGLQCRHANATAGKLAGKKPDWGGACVDLPGGAEGCRKG